MNTYTHDWTVVPRAEWPQMFADNGITADQPWRFLEIGCFEGQTTVWLLDNILSHPDSTITVVDLFDGDFDFVSDPEYPDRFRDNVRDYQHKVDVRVGRSVDMLPKLRGTFDFVYVDGSHEEDDVWADATLAWPLLRYGGLMVFDDYVRPDVEAAVGRFLEQHADALVVRTGAQCVVVKQ